MIYDLLTRFHTYETQTMPIIEHYQKLGLVRKIQASKSPDEVRPSNHHRYILLATPYIKNISYNFYNKQKRQPREDLLKKAPNL